MARFLLNLLTAAILFASLATAGMWVRSYYVADEARWLIPVSDPAQHDWQGLLGLYRIYCIQSSRGAVGGWIRNREAWLSTPFPQAGFSYRAAEPVELPNCTMDHVFGAGDARCYPNELGFAFRWDRNKARGEWNYEAQWTARMMVVPWWLVFFGFALLPIVRFARATYRMIATTHDPNRCRRCGYDLRATPDRCPECGTAREQQPNI